MAITPCTVTTNLHSAIVGDSPAKTVSELKIMFDKPGTDLKAYINDELIPDIGTDIAAAIDTAVDALPTTFQTKITSGTAAPSEGSDGDIYLRY